MAPDADCCPVVTGGSNPAQLEGRPAAQPAKPEATASTEAAWHRYRRLAEALGRILAQPIARGRALRCAVMGALRERERLARAREQQAEAAALERQERLRENRERIRKEEAEVGQSGFRVHHLVAQVLSGNGAFVARLRLGTGLQRLYIREAESRSGPEMCMEGTGKARRSAGGVLQKLHQQAVGAATSPNIESHLAATLQRAVESIEREAVEERGCEGPAAAPGRREDEGARGELGDRVLRVPDRPPRSGPLPTSGDLPVSGCPP